MKNKKVIKIRLFNSDLRIFGSSDLKVMFNNHICVFVFLLLTICIPSIASAQQLALELWPPLLEVMIQPGKSITQVFELTNTGSSDLTLTSKVVPFEPLGSDGQIKLLENFPNNQQLTLSSERFFSFQNADLALGDTFTLKAGQHRQIVLKISISPEQAEDDHYFTLLFENLSSFPSSGFTGESTAGAQIQVGANILLTISRRGLPTLTASLTDFSLANPLVCIRNLCLIDSLTPPIFNLRVANTSSAFFKSFGTISTTGWFNQKFIRDLLPENILANSERRLRCALTLPGSDSQNTITYSPTTCRPGNQFYFGLYQTELTVKSESADLTSGSLHWFSFPFSLLLAFTTALIILKFIHQNRPSAKN